MNCGFSKSKLKLQVPGAIVLDKFYMGFDAHILAAVKRAIEFGASLCTELSPNNDMVNSSHI